jgi:signal transduction histidine kinase
MRLHAEFRRRAHAFAPPSGESFMTLPGMPTAGKPMSIRTYLGWIMLSALLPIGVFTGTLMYFLWNTQQLHRDEEQIARVRAMASVVQSEIDSTISRLELLATDPLLRPDDLAGFHARAHQLLGQSKDWGNVLLVSPSQQLMNAAVPFSTELPATEELSYVREAFSTARPTTSDLIMARVRKVRTISVAVPVMRDGRAAYLLIAALDLNYLSQMLAKLVPDDGVSSLLDRNYNIVARTRDVDTYAGQLPGSRLLAAAQSRREGITRSTIKEGVDVFTAFTRLDNGWTLGVATPSAQSDRALATYLVGLVTVWLAVLVLGVALARVLLRRIDRSIAQTVEAANELAAGHQVSFPPATVRELSALSSALSSLFQRERQARAEEEAANRTKDEFLAMLGHELRNPLAPITTALHLMKLRGGDAFLKERGIIERQVQHMVRLIDDLLDVARITRGTVVLKRAPVEIGAVVAKAVETATPLLEQRRLQLDVQVPVAGLVVNGDATRLSQVLSNLLTNAAKFTPQGGHVAVHGRAVGGMVEITVTDDGIGMDADELARVFELFMQGRQSVDRPHGGLGLGLAIARSLALLHDGELTASSAGRGQGSTFRLMLPQALVLSAPEGAEPAAVLAAPNRTGSVLVVDDNVDAALLLRDLLAGWGFETQVAHDGPSALQLLRTHVFDTAVLDIGLPGMDGYELAEQIREHPQGKTMRLIALTGYGQVSDRLKASAVGFDTHLVKPVDVQMLARAME